MPEAMGPSAVYPQQPVKSSMTTAAPRTRETPTVKEIQIRARALRGNDVRGNEVINSKTEARR